MIKQTEMSSWFSSYARQCDEQNARRYLEELRQGEIRAKKQNTKRKGVWSE